MLRRREKEKGPWGRGLFLWERFASELLLVAYFFLAAVFFAGAFAFAFEAVFFAGAFLAAAFFAGAAFFFIVAIKTS